MKTFLDLNNEYYITYTKIILIILHKTLIIHLNLSAAL